MMSWDDQPHWADTTDELIVINKSRDKLSDTGVGIFYWDSHGRIKLDRDDPNPKVSIGYRVLTMEIDSQLGSLPGGASDVAVVTAVELGRLNEQWTLHLIGGVGTANDNHFANEDAIYGIGTLHATQTIDPTRRLHVGLNYYGNRSIFPDVPLPYLMYEQRVDETMAVVLGVPASSLRWQPVEGVAVELKYLVPVTLEARAAFYITPDLSVFAHYKSSRDGFYVHNRGNRRLFYEMDRVSAGVRWVSRLLDLSVAVGYAFDQEFTLGWDVRDTDTVADLSDEVFLLLRLQGTF